MSTRRTRTVSPSMRAPKQKKVMSRRGLIGLVLTLLLPPIGLMYLWKLGVFQVRGRALLSAIATVEMTLLVIWMLPSAEVMTVVPVPVTPQRVTAAPEGEVLTALSNIDDILRQQQAANGADGTPVPSTKEQLEMEEAERQEILATIVYAYNGSGARYYHKEAVCGRQTNYRELTVQQALAEGMGACPDCQPPQVGLAPGVVNVE